MKLKQTTGFVLGMIGASLVSVNERDASADPPAGSTWATSGTSRVAVFPPTAEATSYRPGDSASDLGGPFQTNAHIVVMFWGSYWSSSAAAAWARWDIQSSIGTLTSGVYFSQLSQYGGINTPVVDGVWIYAESDPPTSFDACSGGGGDVIGDFVLNELAGGDVPGHGSNTPNMVYVVVTPPATQGTGSPCHSHSPSGPFDYEWLYLHTYDGTAAGVPFPIATTEDFSHETVESISDYYTEVHPGWVMNTGAVGENELADGCFGFATLDGVVVRPYWSNAQSACVVPFPYYGPGLTGLSTTEGPLSGQNQVTIEGSGFDLYGSTDVTVGGRAAEVIGALCPSGSGLCCESTTSCTVLIPASEASIVCNQNDPVQTVPVQVTSNGMIASNPNVQYSYDEAGPCAGVPCGSGYVYSAAGQCVYIGAPCGASTGSVTMANGQCAAVGSACGSTPGAIVSNSGACVTPGAACVINGDAPGIWSSGGACVVQNISCPPGQGPFGPPGAQYCEVPPPPAPVHGGGSGGGGCKTCPAPQ
jgi:hypothetical protein